MVLNRETKDQQEVVVAYIFLYLLCHDCIVLLGGNDDKQDLDVIYIFQNQVEVNM
jgi:hypothetical protein